MKRFINTRPKILCAILLLIEFSALSICILWAFHHIHNLSSLNISIQDMTCNISVYHDGAFAVEGEQLNSGKELDFLYGPSLPIKKGSYVANIEYETEQDQYCYGNGTNSKMLLILPPEFIKASKGILNRNSNHISYKFEIPEDVQNFNLIFHYNGLGDFKIKNLSISPTATYYKRTISSVLFILIGIDIAIFISRINKKRRNEILLVFTITFIISIPVFFNNVGLNSGDREFHMLRIEAMKTAIMDRQFPPRVSSVWLYGYGFPASIYYNDILLIFPAILRILGYDIEFTFKANVLAINLLSAIIAYWSFTKLFKNQKIGTLTAISYLLAPYRLIDLYIRMALGEYTALTFLPLIGYGIVNMYRENPQDWKSNLKYGTAIIIGISGVAASHTLSLLIVLFFLMLVFLVFLKRSLKIKTIRLWLFIGITSLMLSAYFLVPFMDYYFNVNTLIKQNTMVRGSGMIQNNGISLGRLFVFFPTSTNFAKDGTVMPLSPGLLFFLTLIAGIWYYRQTGKKKYLYYIGFSLFSIYIATDFFPWNFLEIHTILGQILASVQFPFRFLMITNLILSILLGELLSDLEIHKPMYASKAAQATILFNFIFMVVFISAYGSGKIYEKKYEFESLDSSTTGLLYLPVNAPTNAEDYDTNFISENVNEISLISRKTHTMVIHATSETGGWIEVPILNYKGYQVHDGRSRELDMYTGTNGRIGIKIPESFDNTIYIEFIDPWYWRASIYLSIITCIVFTFSIFFKRKKNKKNIIHD